MIRGILAFGFAALYVILGCPCMLIVEILRKKAPAAADRFTRKYVEIAFAGILFISGVKVEATGLENIPEDRTVVFYGNHQSIFDIICSYQFTKGATGYLAKDNLLKVPLLRTWMRYVHCEFLDRTDLRKGLETIGTCAAAVEQGVNFFVFPEGTRNRVKGTLLPIHAGSFKIAQKAGAPIIPVAISGISDTFDNHKPAVHKSHVLIQFGSPIETAGLKPAERKLLPAKTEAAIRAMLIACGEMEPETAEKEQPENAAQPAVQSTVPAECAEKIQNGENV